MKITIDQIGNEFGNNESGKAARRTPHGAS